MEWKKVRSFLLLLMLAADVVLLGNIGWQLLQLRQTNRAATENAVELAAQQGVTLELSQVLALPEHFSGYAASRSSALEKAAAETLLGDCTGNEPGGGVTVYQSDSGKLSFRRGGALEGVSVWAQASLEENDVVRLLKSAGLNLDQAEKETGPNSVTLYQTQRGRAIVNCRLTCTLRDGRLHTEGRWLISDALTVGQESKSRAELVMALTQLLQSRGVTEVSDLQAGYFLLSDSAQGLELVPVWIAETQQGQVILNCISKKQLVF